MKLYIIGNGFDLHHNLDTSYRSFGLFLKYKYPVIYDRLIEYYGFSDLDGYTQKPTHDALWNEFEESLSLLDPETVFEAHSHSLANPGSSEFRDRDWGTFSIDMEMVVDSLTTNLFKAFREFVLAVEYLPLNFDLKLSLDNSAQYFSFNYTDTLEHYYGIPEENINYIHGKAQTNGDVLILGHGVEPDNFENEDPRPPKDLTSEQMEVWLEQMNDNYDHSFELGKQELLDYFFRTFKQTKEVILLNSIFYNKIHNINEVFVLGHSLSEIDMPYFEEIIRVINSNPIFTVTYYSQAEHDSHKKTLLNLGIKEKRINLIKMDEL
ncbi:MAG: bacteriophage abortive infection AbiH family protein [Candidatus Thiodiazotropha sp. (ex Troendleina suluensis)]|nr:bacteriophage abortive infection AbiH family protein [Candidatus Thiodiazotropha sp. (ex Troendleina suluensis)]